MTVRRILALGATLAILGAGCLKPAADYLKAPTSTPIEVKPNVEGSKASTGGAEATITPPLATELLVQSLPKPPEGWTATTPVESKQPVPLPDGTRSEVTRLESEYVKGGDAVKNVKISITDTRGIPALLLFIESYEESAGESGYRKKMDAGGAPAWLTYAFGPNREADGTGSVTLIYRQRFHIQLDGGTGVSASDLTNLVSSFNFDALK